MTKTLFCILFCAVAFMTNGCASVQVVPSVAMRSDVYLLSARATSRKILSETIKSAKERCDRENKQYLFVKNIFQHNSTLGIDSVSYDLYFTCVEAGDSRLNERKSLLRPAEEKMDQAGQKIDPDKDRGQVNLEDHPGLEKPPALGQTIPATEIPEEKPSVNSGKEAAPTPEMLLPLKDENQGQQKESAKVSEEQLRKKNPGMGELESLRKDDSPLDDEPKQDSPIIEEDLGGYALDKANYLKRRFRKKKQTN